MNEAEQGTERPARRAASVRLIAGGTALGFAAAGLVGVLFVAASGDDGGGRAERIAQVDETTTTTAAPGDEVAVTTTVPPAGQPAGGVPSGGGGGTTPAEGPVPAPAAASVLEAQVADHEQRITDLEETPVAEPAPVVVPPPPDPPGPERPPAPSCDGRLQWSDVQGWICLPATPPTEP